MAKTDFPEWEYYLSQRSKWMRSHKGRFVVIRAREPLGFFDTERAAFVKAVETYRSEEFSIFRVGDKGRSAHLSVLTGRAVGKR